MIDLLYSGYRNALLSADFFEKISVHQKITKFGLCAENGKEIVTFKIILIENTLVFLLLYLL